ncbi:flagellar basal-body MS-ring/collar protein FliF [Sphingomonas phyllosphaerae]|uniref:flagellar basal-body MS-ring/collar protein FliF n=1 Tax=Sphingomonas phyllosphaerae TaxID=257003 RepID=UPI0003FC5B37|nr:flagellar basal-body MS-ring/collar protein FliF [Sphingomonas phyllosphaerae]
MSDDPAPARRPSPRLIAILFALLFCALAIGYFLFLGVGYVPVFTQMRPGDAAAVVAQLDAKEIAYRLADGGTSVLVREDQADGARVAVAGSDVALKGGVGFELFNKSDMGLTDFAQRINYQRALQGELERSIMLIAEVESARVHLAVPERTIFRAERRNAKAAVELVIKPGRSFDVGRVAGVQQLVAFAVPDLTAADVVVLDGSGRVLSASAVDTPDLSPEAEEQRSVRGYYRARVRAALTQALPGVEAEVTVAALGDGAAGWSEGEARRNFRLRVIVATPAPLNDEDAAVAREAVVRAVALDEAAGDELVFRVGVGPSPVAAPAVETVAVPAPGVGAQAKAGIDWTPVGIALGLLLVFGAGTAAAVRRRGARMLNDAERAAMVARVRAALASGEAAA